MEGGARAAQVGGAGDAAGPPGFRAGSRPRHLGEDFYQCGGSGIWDPVPFLLLVPGSGKGKKSESGMNNLDHMPEIL
jgi:hypothetical protein